MHDQEGDGVEGGLRGWSTGTSAFLAWSDSRLLSPRHGPPKQYFQGGWKHDFEGADFGTINHRYGFGLRAPLAIVNVGRLEVFESAPRVYRTFPDPRFGIREVSRPSRRAYRSALRSLVECILRREGQERLGSLVDIPAPLAVHTAVPFGHLWNAS